MQLVPMLSILLHQLQLSLPLVRVSLVTFDEDETGIATDVVLLAEYLGVFM